MDFDKEVKFDKELEEHNLTEIVSLQQRGGRMLTLVDLLRDRTLNLEMGAFLLYAMTQNLSFLTAAGPSGTGKTTLMGSLLALLKPGVKLETYNGNRQLPLSRNSRFLIHEINNAPYHGYLFDKRVGEFFSFINNSTIAASLHAESLSRVEETLETHYLEVDFSDFYEVDLILFMVKKGGLFQTRRRISKIYGSLGDSFTLLYRWQEDLDKFSQENLGHYLKRLAKNNNIYYNDIEKEISVCRRFLRELQRKDIKELVEVRKKFLSFYDRHFKNKTQS